MEKLLNWLTTKRVIMLLAIIGAVFYANALANGFVWDDEEQIVTNVIIHSLSNIGQIFSGGTFSTGGGDSLSGWFFRPFLTLFYMINWTIWGNNAYGFHLVQIILHLINGYLLFNLLQKLSKPSKAHQLLNCAVALIFIVHPAISEAVDYIAAASELLFTFFNLWAIKIILNNKSKSWRNFILVSGMLFIGMLYKESSIVIFPIIGCLLFIYRTQSWKRWLSVITLTLSTYLVVRLVIIQTPFRHPEFAPISEASLLTRLLTMPLELWSYLRIIFYPDYLSISQHFLVTSFNVNFFAPLLLDLLFFGSLIWLGWKAKSKLITFGLCWFLISFGLISNIFPLDMTIAERWLYFPLIGLMICFTGVLQLLLHKWPHRLTLITTLLSIAILILGIRTMVRNSNWRDGLTLYSHDVQLTQNSFDLENNVGVELFRAQRYSEAKEHFQRSIALQPGWYFTYNNLGAIYQREGNLPAAERYYKKTLEMSDYYLAYENLASVYLGENNPQQAKDFSSAALKKLPYNPRLWFSLAIADYQLNDKPAALQAAQNAFNLAPSQQYYDLVQALRQEIKPK